MTEIISEAKIIKILEDHPARAFTAQKLNEYLNANELSLQRKLRQLYYRGVIGRYIEDKYPHSYYYHIKQ